MEANDWDEPSWIESVVAAARNPQQWLASAMRCKRASDLLREDWLRQTEARTHSTAEQTSVDVWASVQAPSVARASAFFGGTALENLLKGILIARDPTLVQPDGKNPDRMYNWPGRGHDLPTLAHKAEIPLLSGDRETLAVLTDFIGWAGRYPTGMSATRMRPLEDRPHERGVVSSEHFQRLDELFDRLTGALTAEARDWQRRQEDEALEHRGPRREELLRELPDLDVVDADGVRLFVADVDVPGGAPRAVTCVACGARMGLDGGHPAAICRCGTLRHYRWDWVAGPRQAPRPSCATSVQLAKGNEG